MNPEAPQRPANRLIHETSPYLLQHAHNPVNWYPWGEEALNRARAEDKPILLSIGYSACHWCHVMERESFEDEKIARLMNGDFICIKVDREERPDLDEIYMAATTAMNNGQGGWPMTVFLAPNQEPFFAGTYFPPVDRYGRPGFSTVLNRVAELWKSDRKSLLKQGAQLAEHLRAQTVPIPSRTVGSAAIDQAAADLAREFDPIHGGFGGAPKFPPSMALSLLLRVHRRTGDDTWLKIVRVTLNGMAHGGIYDQIGGGFARYSTDERWLVPHFEKMLYDNALLARIYLEAHQATGEELYRRIAAETLDYILREMTDLEGGFYSSTDADSEGEEGKFFVWNPEEIQKILGKEDADLFCAFYDISEAGNWEGKSIPHIPRSLEQVSRQLDIPGGTIRSSLDRSRPRVYEARRKRVAPGLDDKILTSWNGLMIGAMAEGARILGDDRYRKAGERASDFILGSLKGADGRLLRTYRKGKAHLKAGLEDYAYFCQGLIDLYESGSSPRYLAEADRLARLILEDFGPEDGGGFFHTGRDHERLIVRHREGHDGALPNPNAVAAMSLARLSHHLNREDDRTAAVSALRAYGRVVERYPRAFCSTLSVVDFLLEGPIEIAFLGTPGDRGLGSIRDEVRRVYLPNRIIAHRDPAEPVQDSLSLPLLEGKGLIDGKSSLFLCHNFTCRAPITDPAEVGAALSAQGEQLKNSRRPEI